MRVNNATCQRYRINAINLLFFWGILILYGYIIKIVLHGCLGTILVIKNYI